MLAAMAHLEGLTSRPFTGRDDLRAMQGLMSATWLGPRRPLVPGTPGDLAWWTAQGGPDADWSSRIRTWERAGRVVAWGWFQPPNGLDWFVGDGLDEGGEREVRAAILGWFGATVRDQPGGAAEARTIETWAADGWSEATFLVRAGWTPTETTLSQHVQPLDLPLDPLRVPDGYVLRTMRGPEDIPARVEVHRAAFAPSKLTVEKYRILVEQDGYAWDRDVVVEAPDGSFAAFAMCWADPVGQVGEFEPVGTHPDHQRRGLGRVVMRHGLRLLRAAGMRDAIVFSLAANRASEALYRSAGFQIVATHRRYERSLEDALANVV
jgi:mycothiol synthase